MARHVPGQLCLFRDVPAGLLATSEPAGPWQPEPRPDQLLLVLPIGGKAAGALIGVGESLADRHGLGAPDYPDLFYLPVFDLGRADELPERQLGILCAALDKRTLPRFAVSAGQIGALSLDDGLPAAALLLAPSPALEMFCEELGLLLRARSLGNFVAPADSSVLLLGRTLASVPDTPLDRPLELPLRELALIRVLGATGRNDLVRKWTLAG